MAMQRRYVSGRKARGKLPNTISEGEAEENHNLALPHVRQNGLKGKSTIPSVAKDMNDQSLRSHWWDI